MTWNRSGQFKRMLSLGACGSGDREPSPGGDFLSKATLSYKPIYKQTLDCAHAANILRKDRWPNYFRENTSQRAEGRFEVRLQHVPKLMTVFVFTRHFSEKEIPK